MSTFLGIRTLAPFTLLLLVGSGTLAQNSTLTPSTWQAFPSGPTGMQNRVLLADANSDGLSDAMVADAHGKRVACWLRSPGGGWSNPTITSLAYSHPVLVDALDLDMDGLSDLVVQTVSGIVNLMGSGTGSFTVSALQTPPLSLSLNTWGLRSPAAPQHALADVDNDGAIELVSIRGARLPPQLISTYELVGGSWSLAQQETHTTMEGGWLPPLGDYDGNGFPDLTVVPYRTAYIFPTSITICPNTSGAFNLAPELVFSMDIWRGAVSVADVSGDGLADFLFTDRLPTGNVIFKCYLGHPQGVLAVPPILTPSPGSPSAWMPYFGDFDADGILDVAQLDLPGGTFSSHVRLSRTGGSLSAPISATHGSLLPNQWPAIGVGDLDLDGDADMVFVRDRAGGGCDVGVVTNQAIYGPGAVSVGQVPGFLAGTATPGNSAFTLSLVNANPGLPAGLAVSTASSFVTPPVWVDLLPGNLILPSGSLGLFTTDALGRAEMSFDIPPWTGLLGTTFYAQWAVSDLAGIPYGAFALAFSQARQIVIW